MNGKQRIADITESQLEKLLIALGKKTKKDEILKLHAKIDLGTEKVMIARNANINQGLSSNGLLTPTPTIPTTSSMPSINFRNPESFRFRRNQKDQHKDITNDAFH